MKCKCGYEVEESCKFCPECGEACETDEKRCSECAQAMGPAQKFCSTCGAECKEGEETCPEPVEEKNHGTLKIVTAYRCGEVFPVADGMIVGKGTDVDVPLPEDSYLSHEHARISVLEDKVLLKDLESRNGIFVQLMDEKELKDGDRLLVGSTVFEYSSTENAHG